MSCEAGDLSCGRIFVNNLLAGSLVDNRYGDLKSGYCLLFGVPLNRVTGILDSIFCPGPDGFVPQVANNVLFCSFYG